MLLLRNFKTFYPEYKLFLKRAISVIWNKRNILILAFNKTNIRLKKSVIKITIEKKFILFLNADLVDARTVMTSQTEYLRTLAADVGYEGNLDGCHIFMDLTEGKAESVVTHKDKCQASLHLGTTATPPKTSWIEFFDYLVKGFCDNCWFFSFLVVYSIPKLSLLCK